MRVLFADLIIINVARLFGAHRDLSTSASTIYIFNRGTR